MVLLLSGIFVVVSHILQGVDSLENIREMVRTSFFYSRGREKVEPNRDIKRKNNWTCMNFLQNHAIFRSDQSNDMRYKNKKLMYYIKQKTITAEMYIYK